jgi:hypothetical protein
MIGIVLFLLFIVLFSVAQKDTKNLPDEQEDEDFVVPLEML